MCDPLEDIRYLEGGQRESVALRLKFSGFACDEFLFEVGVEMSVTGWKERV